MVELLAPAGDMKCFDTAIACGADAVYLGLSDFNARRKAENFNADNIAEVIRKAHFFGVKVYVTVNTLVRDGEMRSLIELVKSAAAAGADAYIVQDLGVARCLKQVFPNIVLHASTQLGIHNLYGAKQAEKAGFARVVLSRETKRDDIRAIRDNTGLEIEYFVQGALCVAFSGNCYLSATECGASGNRGLCKQLCRLPYTAEVNGDTAEGYLLSAKDLCLADSLQDLIDAGVTSFKIEGRMRSENYVGSAVSVYRRLLDGLQHGQTDIKLHKDDRYTLRTAYSRGESYLTRAYLDDATPTVIEKNFNNHTGVGIGVVKRVKPFKTDLYEVTVLSDRPLKNGDGLKFFAKTDNGVKGKNIYNTTLKEVASVGIGSVTKSGDNTYTFVTKTALKEGWQVNLIFSSETESTLENLSRKVYVDFEVRALAGEPLYIKASCGSVYAEAAGEICQKAINAPVDETALLVQVKKVGDSGFATGNASAITNGVFIPKSAINALRRQVLESLTEKLIDANTKRIEFDAEAAERIINVLPDVKQYSRLRFYRSDDVNNGGDIVTDIRKTEMSVLCPAEYTAKEVGRMTAALGLTADKVALQLPVIANGKDIAMLEKLLSEFPQIKTLVSENIYGLEYADRGYRVIAGAGHNAFNAYACQQLTKLGASEVLPSVESGTREGIKGAEIPLMTFAHCPYKTVYGNDCAHCTFSDGMIIKRGKRCYKVARTKLHNCYFGLFPTHFV